MPYTIPSSAVTPGTVYQPGRGVPAYIRSNARAMACIKGGALSATHMLDQSPRNNGTRRTGQQGRCYNFDGIDDIVIANYQDLNLKGDLVLACRFNWDNGSASDKFLISFAAAGEAEDANVQYSIFLQASSGNELKYFHEYGSGTNEIVSLGWTPDPDVNYNLVVTRDSVNKIIKAYINGSEVGSNTYTNDPTGGSSAVFGIGRLNGSPVPFSGKIWDVRIDDSIWGVDKINNYSSFGEFEEIGPVLGWWKCDEQSGTVAYDSSGNGYHGTITNATLSTFHATQDIWSFQNQVGYNLSGSVYIPRDESDPTNDVLGNPLSYTGRRPNDFKLTGSNCLTADGTLYIAAAHLAGTETVVSSGGTSTPTISTGRIDFTAGTCWDLTLSDGTHYPLSEGWGVDIGSSTSDNDGILTNSVLANAWGATQDEYHYNILNGFSLYEHASTAAIRWPFKNGSVKTLTPPAGYSKTSDNYAGDYHNDAETTVDFDPDSTPEMGPTQLGITVPSAHAFGAAFTASDQIFSRQRTKTEDRFLVFTEAQTGSALTNIQKYTQP
jgi:hypothetical protein